MSPSPAAFPASAWGWDAGLEEKLCAMTAGSCLPKNEGAREDGCVVVPVSGGREVSGPGEVTRRGKDGDSSHGHTLVNLQSHQKQ